MDELHSLKLEKRLPVPAEVAWPWLVEPLKMNRWSLAAVRLLAPGDGGVPEGVGAVRQVVVSLPGGRTAKLIESVEESEPPRRFVYRVVDVPLVRAHRGVITLDGHDLTWKVDFALANDALTALVAASLRPQLEKSLENLARVTQHATADRTYPPAKPFEDTPTAEDRERAQAILHEQRALADRLERANDPKRWFCRVYEYVTEAQLQAVDAGTVKHTRWVLRLIPRFHHYYLSNLRRWMGEEHGTAEPQWQRAFTTMERPGDARRALFGGIKQAVIAHVEEDLPRALAEVWAWHYADRCDYVRFRCDYLLMGHIFDGSALRLLGLLPRSWVPWYVRVLGSNLTEVSDAFMKRSYYDMRKQRRLAFERGERIGEMIRPSSSASSPDRG